MKVLDFKLDLPSGEVALLAFLDVEANPEAYTGTEENQLGSLQVEEIEQ